MKAYEAHETEYRRMKAQGVRSWDLRNQSWEIDPSDIRFLEYVVGQPWAPRKGKAVELGCGTAPLLRWLSKKGFSGLGGDVSATAIEMARAQSADFPLTFIAADLCRWIPPPAERGTMDLCVDGHLLHCITNAEDRAALLYTVRSLLRNPGGVFVVMSMCAPVDTERIGGQTQPRGRYEDSILWTPLAFPASYDDQRIMEGTTYLPIRYIPSEESLLGELRAAGFVPMQIQFTRYAYGEETSSVNIALVPAS